MKIIRTLQPASVIKKLFFYHVLLLLLNLKTSSWNVLKTTQDTFYKNFNKV